MTVFVFRASRADSDFFFLAFLLSIYNLMLFQVLLVLYFTNSMCVRGWLGIAVYVCVQVGF